MNKNIAGPADDRGSVAERATTTYVGNAVSFIRSNGAQGFVIRSSIGAAGSLATGKPATELQFSAWLRYFDAMGIRSTFLRYHGMGTVPCEYPDDFDCRYRDAVPESSATTRRAA